MWLVPNSMFQATTVNGSESGAIMVRAEDCACNEYIERHGYNRLGEFSHKCIARSRIALAWGRIVVNCGRGRS